GLTLPAGLTMSTVTFKGRSFPLEPTLMDGMHDTTLPATHTPPPPPPPPPPDHHPTPTPPPPASGSSFTFYLPWPSGPQEEKEDQDVLDLALEDDALIETGVTSGSDSSVWDPIHVDPDH